MKRERRDISTLSDSEKIREWKGTYNPILIDLALASGKHPKTILNISKELITKLA